MLSSYITSLRGANPTTPIIIDENGAISCLSEYMGKDIVSFDECLTGEMGNIFLYGIPEEKQHFDIITVRKCIADMGFRPYEGKTIAVLRDFDTATLEAQNAMLKLLEDCPEYVAIMLVVDDLESLIDTIRSRTISLYRRESGFYLSGEVQKWVDDFFIGEKDDLIKYLYIATYKKEEAIAILRYAFQRVPNNSIVPYEQGILDLFSTNENPRNIIDRIFLIPC